MAVMSLAERTAELFGAGGPIAAMLGSYEARPGQRRMAERVAEAFDSNERLLCEAGTGTGKTLAYLIPAILSQRKVVVSTGSKTLQDQIAQIDLPRLQRSLGVPFSFAVMKGLSNYVCLRRMSERMLQGTLAGTDNQTEHQLAAIRAWVSTSPDGDRAELDGVPDEAAIWRDVVATPETRLGSRCKHYRECFVTGMRERAATAQIIVTNHHLFFADLALRAAWPEAQVLPAYDAVIFDEAHQLEDVATEFFGLQVSSQRFFALARDLSRLPMSAGAGERAQILSRHLAGLADDLTRVVRQHGRGNRNANDESRMPLPDDLFSGDPADPNSPRALYLSMDTLLDEIANHCRRLGENGPPTLDGHRSPPPAEIAAVLTGLARRASQLRDGLAVFAERGSRDTVRWLTSSPHNIALRASPIDVAPLLTRAFDAHPGPLIFTSATLSVARNFDYVRARLGVRDAASEATFASPFRYQEQTLIYLPEDLTDPNQDRFSQEAADRAIALCEASRGRALCLYTSFRALRIAETAFRAHGKFPLLVQGERPKLALLDGLRTQIGAVLLATQSFWEGVDVPGEALSLVVMDRIPFASPDEPLVAARARRIEEENGDPFTSYQLPRAALALRQGFGRLIRTRTDRGVVAFLDGRLLRKSYGGTLLGSLPPECRRTDDLEEVRAFFAAG